MKPHEEGYGQICWLCERPVVKRPLEPPPVQRPDGKWEHRWSCSPARPTGQSGLGEILRLSQRRP